MCVCNVYMYKVNLLPVDYFSLEPDGKIVAKITSDSNGMVEIKGLAYGTYYLVETEAPVDSTSGKSYNLLSSSQEITINASSHETSNNYRIINRMGPVLPITGSVGTIIISIIGIVLVVIGTKFFKKEKSKRSK